MEKVRKQKTLFWSSVVCMGLMAASFLFMPIASRKSLEGAQWWTILSGLIFWLPLLLGYILFFLTNRCRKKTEGPDSMRGGPKFWGLFHVFSNRWAIAADIGFLIGLVGFVIFLFVAQESYGTYIFLFLTVFLFQMHGVFNGVNYAFLYHKNKTLNSNSKQEDN